MTTEETAAMLAVLAAVWPKDKIAPDTERVYHLALSDLPGAWVQEAATQWIRANKWFPKPAELREIVVEQMAPIPSGFEAWAEVKGALNSYGPGREPAWSTPELAAVMKGFGWRNFCMSEIGDEPTIRAQFTRAYDAKRAASLKHINLGMADTSTALPFSPSTVPSLTPKAGAR